MSLPQINIDTQINTVESLSEPKFYLFVCLFLIAIDILFYGVYDITAKFMTFGSGGKLSIVDTPVWVNLPIIPHDMYLMPTYLLQPT